MVLDDAKVGMDVATDKQIVRFRLDAVVVMQHKEELLLIDSRRLWRTWMASCIVISFCLTPFPYLNDSLDYLFRTIDKELTMVHAFENLDMCLRIKRKQMFRLRLGDKRFFRAIPEMDVIAGDGFQLIGINGFVAI